MTGPCPRCGTDPGFEWAICPGCGMRADSPDAPVSDDRWDPTIMERSVVRERARFTQGEDFYQPIAPADGGRPLRFGDADVERTVLDRGFDRAGGAVDDHTIIERRSHGSEDARDDSTVIIRSGRKGVTGPLAYLVQRNGIRAGRVYLVAEETAIGRGADQAIVISDETVSKRHAKVRREEGKFKFWDLASSNGSFILQPDGSRTRILEPHELRDGDTIFVGEARLTYIEVDRGAED